MLVIPDCPKCRIDRRVIASYKPAPYPPSRIKKLAVAIGIKIVLSCAKISNKAMSYVNQAARQKYIYRCVRCNHEFQGTQTQKKEKQNEN